jgi:hypothetical protein
MFISPSLGLDRLESFFKDVRWNKPLFSRGHTSLEKVLTQALSVEPNQFLKTQQYEKNMSNVERHPAIMENMVLITMPIGKTLRPRS